MNMKDIGDAEISGAEIVIKIETKEPVELENIVKLLSSIDRQYRAFSAIRKMKYEEHGECPITVRTVRPGCIVIGLIILAVGLPAGFLISKYRSKFLNQLEEQINSFGNYGTKKMKKKATDSEMLKYDGISEYDSENIIGILAPIKKGAVLSIAAGEHESEESEEPVEIKLGFLKATKIMNTVKYLQEKTEAAKTENKKIEKNHKRQIQCRTEEELVETILTAQLPLWERGLAAKTLATKILTEMKPEEKPEWKIRLAAKILTEAKLGERRQVATELAKEIKQSKLR